jgi:hypothetical protein
VSHRALMAGFEKSVQYWIATKMPARGFVT